MTPAERNRAEFPEFAAIVDEIRARGGTAKILWAANSTGYQVGPVPAGWDDVFSAPPSAVACATSAIGPTVSNQKRCRAPQQQNETNKDNC